ncbi:MAG: type II toxin-antitoxin system HicB family antitoxin [Candidatus Woesearchaeota archaeon]
MGKTYTVIIEQDEDGMFIGKVSGLKGCVTQGSTVDELIKNMKEALELYLEENTEISGSKFVGVQQIEVAH